MLLDILNWSEFWALLIPLGVLLKYKRQPKFLKPVIIYLWIALIVNLAIDTIMEVNMYYNRPIVSNLFLYNIHSIVRFVCFSSFFALLKQPFIIPIKKYLPFVAGIFLIVNFVFFENFFNKNSFSSRLVATEAGILLFYCLQYYLFKLQEDKVAKRQADFWVVTGLSIYVVFNFPYFLLYSTLIEKHPQLCDDLWNYHNITYIIFCIFIAKAFYVARNK